MCLSNVYRKNGDEDVFMLKNIAQVQTNGDKLIFTDLMGARTEFTGTIINIDLLENIILVRNKEEI